MEWWQTTLTIFAGLITCLTLWDKIESRIKAAKQPTKSLEGRVEVLERKIDLEYKTILADYELRFKRDLERINEIERSNKLIIKSLLALMRHAEDGNNIDKLKETSAELQNYILNK